MAALTEKQRNRMIKYFYEEKTFRQIAEEEGTHVNSVFYSVRSGKEQIKKYLKNVV